MSSKRSAPVKVVAPVRKAIARRPVPVVAAVAPQCAMPRPATKGTRVADTKSVLVADALVAQVDFLHERISTLETRMMPLCCPVPIGIANEAQPANSSLVATLAQAIARVADACDRVNSLTTAIDNDLVAP